MTTNQLSLATLATQFPDLQNHTPDCSAVTTDELLSVTRFKWTQYNIPYSISHTEPDWIKKLIIHDRQLRQLHAREIPADLLKIATRHIEFIFNKYSEMTHGKLHFTPQKTFHSLTPFVGDAFAQGITFIMPGAMREIAEKAHAGGLTIRRINNNGDIRGALIYLPNDAAFWKEAETHEFSWMIQTISHEIQHALGIEDFTQFKSILNKLNATEDGIYCSVMPYSKFFTSKISRCNQETKPCSPPYAVFPAQLDQRWLDLVYRDNLWQSPPTLDQRTFYKLQCLENIFETTKFIYFFILWHQSLKSLLQSFARKSLAPKRNQKIVSLMADGLILLALLLIEAPSEVELVFALGSLSHLLPEKIWGKMRHEFQWLLESMNDLSVMLFMALNNGTKFFFPLSICLTLLATTSAFLTTNIAKPIGHALSKIVYPETSEEPSLNTYQRMEEGRLTNHKNWMRLYAKPSKTANPLTIKRISLKA